MALLQAIHDVIWYIVLSLAVISSWNLYLRINKWEIKLHYNGAEWLIDLIIKHFGRIRKRG